jgi:hypothetical protein
MISKGTFLTNTKTFALLPPIYCARMVGDRWQIIAPDESPYASAYRCINVVQMDQLRKRGDQIRHRWRSRLRSSQTLTRFARERLFTDDTIALEYNWISQIGSRASVLPV